MKTIHIHLHDAVHKPVRKAVRDCGCAACRAKDVEFSESMISQLRTEYNKIDTVDPNSPSVQKLQRLLSSLTQEQLKELANAGIKFVSKLAMNRIQR